MPRRLGEEHATHVAAPRRVVVPIKFFDGDLGGEILSRGHRAWGHNLMKGTEHWVRESKLEEHERSLHCEVKTTYEGEGIYGSEFICGFVEAT